MKIKGFILLVLLLLITLGITAAVAQSTETVTTITLQTGALLAEYEDVSQILDIAALRIHSMPEGYGAFALSLNGKDTLQSKFKLESDGIYVQSAMLGQQPLYFTWEDIKAFVMEQMESYIQTQDMLTADEAEIFQAVLDGTLSDEQMDLYAQSPLMDMPFDMETLQALMDGSMTDEQIFEMMGIDEELLTLISDIQARQVAETGSFYVEGSDEANLKTVTEITGEDLVRVIDLPMVREMIASQMAALAYDVSQEEIARQVDAQLMEIKQMIAQSNITVTASVYTMDEDFIAFKLDMTAAMDDYSGGTVPIGIHVLVTRTSVEDAKFYQLSVKLTEADEEFLNQSGSLFVSDEFITGEYVFYAEPDVPVLEATFNCDRTQADHTTAELGLTVLENGPQSVFIVMDQQKADNVKDMAIDVHVGGSIDEIKNTLADTSLITLKLHIVTQEDSGYFAALQNATPETSMQLLTMDETELQTYMQSIQQSMMMTLLSVMENLPPDISNSLMESMGGF